MRLAAAIYNGRKVFGEVRGDYLYILGEELYRISWRAEGRGYKDLRDPAKTPL